MLTRVAAASDAEIFDGKISSDIKRILWVIAISLLVLSPAVFWGIPSNRNLLNHFRFAIPFFDSLRAGHWYPGWLAESNFGYGDASFRFYPPGTYYLLAAARALTGSWYAGSLISFALMFVAGALGMYLWARELVSPQQAMWAGILYTAAPYHVDQIYQAFLLAEFAGAAVLPFAFFFTERVCKRGQLRDIAGLAAAYAILVLTHLPLTIIGSIALAAYAVFRLELPTQWRSLIKLAAATTLGLAASACYWTTMVSELSWIRADNINPDPNVDFRKNFVLSTLSPDYFNVWWMNILLLGTVGMFWPGLVLFRRSAWKFGLPRGVKAAAVVLLLTVAMATPISRPVWNLVHTLQATQFPWRWLSLTSLAWPILFVAALPFWTRLWRERRRPLLLLAAGTMAISIAFSASHIVREAQYLNQTQFNGTLQSIPGSQGVTQWWPRWVAEPIKQMNVAVAAEGRAIEVIAWEPERRVFKVARGKATEARIRTFYYPHWVATVEGGPGLVRPDADGALLVALPANEISVVLEFREPPRVRWAAIFTALGWVAITALVLFGGRGPQTSAAKVWPSFSV